MSEPIALPPLPGLPLPDGTLYGVDRTVRGHPFLPAKVRAYATTYGQLCLDIAQATNDRRVAGLRAGNTELLSVLMHAVGDTTGHNDLIWKTLGKAGMLGADGHLDWSALAARKAELLPPVPPTTEASA